MLTRDQAQNLVSKIIGWSKLPGCEVRLNWTEDAFIRFANNGITTSGFRVVPQISITSATEDRRRGNAAVSEFTDEALRRGVAQAESLALISKPDPEQMPALGPQPYTAFHNFDSDTAAAREDRLISHVKAIVDRALQGRLTAAGFIQRSATAAAVGNKAGLFGYTTFTNAGLSNTMRSAGGTSSGWATQIGSALKDIDGEAAAGVSAEKCIRGARPRKKLDPGKYTVILEPAAVSDAIGWLGFSFDARSAEQGQSWLSKQGGGTHLGEKMFPEYVTLRTDPSDPRFSAAPWGNELLPNEKITWIDKGVVANLNYDRFWAAKANKKATTFPDNVILDGQENTLDDLIKSVDRGLLITRFWYIRMLQPQTLQVTGLTRDGVFLVENGQVTDPVTNYRWNESPVRILQNTVKIGRPVPTIGAEAGASLSPPLVVKDFNLASISDAV